LPQVQVDLGQAASFVLALDLNQAVLDGLL
jgi:hypothetical protein